jgi:FkbM family methyltransferase
MDTQFVQIKKRQESFYIENRTSDQHVDWWKNVFPWWEEETFDIFDKYLIQDKIFIDIGGWIGTTCMYGSRKSKHVYVYEADLNSVEYLKKNCDNNNCRNVTIVDNAVFSSNTYVFFGKNKNVPTSKLNDSMSQVYTDTDDVTNCYRIKAVTIDDIFKQNNLNPFEVSLIKVDIEGGEESILDDLYKIHREYGVTLYVSFHHCWWTDKNLNRFEFLTEEHKNAIYKNPFHSILFTSKSL